MLCLSSIHPFIYPITYHSFFLSFRSFLLSILPFCYLNSFLFSFIPTFRLFLLPLFQSHFRLSFLHSSIPFSFPSLLHFFISSFIPPFLPYFLPFPFLFLSSFLIPSLHLFPYSNIRQFNLHPSILQSVYPCINYYVLQPFFKLSSKNVQIYKL